MLTTLLTETIDYSSVLSPELQLHSFVTLQSDVPYYLVRYRRADHASDTTVLMWRLYEVLELLSDLRNSAGNVLSFVQLDYTSSDSLHVPRCRRVREVWASSSDDNTQLICQLRFADGDVTLLDAVKPNSKPFVRTDCVFRDGLAV